VLFRSAAGGKQRWRSCFERLSSTDDIAAALAVAKKLSVSLAQGEAEGDFQKLSHAGRYNYLLYSLMTGDLEAADDKAVQTVMAEFDTSVRKYCPDLSGQAGVAELLSSMTTIRPSEGAGDLSKLLGDLWSGSEIKRPDGRRAVMFTWKADPQKYPLVFLEVKPSVGKPALLCTTEVSVGLMNDVVEGLKRWAALRSADVLPSVADKGKVFAWKWSGAAGAGGISPNAAWWKPEEAAGGPIWQSQVLNDYDAGCDPGSPTPAHPMQWVSPLAAIEFARLINCRLPTHGEWLAAYEIDKASIEAQLASAAGEAISLNLRDATWKRENDYISKSLTDPGSLPKNHWQNVGNVGGWGSAGDVVAGDDKHVWFAEVEPDAADTTMQFAHLVGNVAELVMDDAPEAAAALGAGQVPFEKVRAAAVDSAKAAKLNIVGGSAMSPPSLWDGKTKPFTTKVPVSGNELGSGYADVGLRLAFTAPTEPLSGKLKKLLTEKGRFLAPGS
jgi:hypothetical protein